jgi:antitoxin Phd
LDCLEIYSEERRAVSWQLQEAKQKFSELVRRTLEEGPQVVTRHGEEVVVVVPVDEFRRMSGEKPTFKEFLMSAPEGLEHIIPERPKDDYPRDVDLTDWS